MSEPRRLSDETSLPLERELLRSGLEDSPPSGARGRAALALGIAAAVATSTAASASVAPSAGAGTAAGATKVGVSSATIKVAVIAALAGAMGGFTAGRFVPARSRPMPSLAIAAPTVVTAASSAPYVATAPSEAIVAAVASAALPVPSPEVGTNRPAGSPSARTQMPPPPASLADEIALLDHARAALAGGDAVSALQLVDEHDAKFRGDTFAVESSVLRIDALDALGRSGSALELADRFLAAHPNAPVSQHVRSVADKIRGGRAHP